MFDLRHNMMPSHFRNILALVEKNLKAEVVVDKFKKYFLLHPLDDKN